MPRKYDRKPIPLDRNPLDQLDTGLGKLPKLNPFDFVESVVQIVIDNLHRIPFVGTVLSKLAELLGLGSAGANGVIGFLQGLAGPIDPSRIPLLSLGHIGLFDTGQEPNLLDNPDYLGEISVDSGDGWAWDDTVGRTAAGSARVTADGTRKVRTSNVIPVTAGQKFGELSGYVKWAGITRSSSGAAFTIELLTYANGSLVSTVNVGAISSPSASSGWQKIPGPFTWTVPAGIDTVRVRIAVESRVTAGDVWWDDLVARKRQLLPMEWVLGLLPKFQDTFNTIADGLDFDHDGDVDLDDVAAALKTIPVANVAGLGGILGGLLPKLDFNGFLSGLKAAGNSGTPGGTGISLIDDALNAIVGVRGKATAAQQGVDEVRATSVTTTAVAGGSVTRISVPGVGNNPITLPDADPGKVIAKIVVQSFGPGQGGARGRTQNVAEAAPGGLHGGVTLQEFLPDQLPKNLLVFNGSGGAGQSGTGYGAYGTPTSVKSADGTTTYVQTVPGVAVSYTLTGVFANGAAAGNGGPGGARVADDSDGGGSYINLNGQRGGNSPAGLGGEGGTTSTGWFGISSNVAPADGLNAPTNDPFKQVGGTGGGGGYARGSGLGVTQSAGANGGAPGAGGGGAGAINATGGLTGTSGAPAGNGGPGRTDFWIYQQEVAA